MLSKVADSGLQKINLNENQLIETRLLVRKSDGWEAFPYVWNDEQTEAFLRVAGASKQISLFDQDSTQTTDFTYFVPNENQCAGCHTTVHPDGDMRPLGALFSQLNTGSREIDAGIASPLEQMVQNRWLNDEEIFPLSHRQITKQYKYRNPPVSKDELLYLFRRITKFIWMKQYD